MKVMKQSVFVFVILAAVFVSCWGGDTDEEALPKVKPKPGFKYFLLALTWPNQYCTTHKCKPSPPEQQRYFTIHGLWPQNTPTDVPQDCNTTIQFKRTELLPMKDKLLKYWPDLKNAKNFKASEGFWRYGWNKHGTCSSNKYRVKEYFEKSIALAEKYSAQIYEALISKEVKPNGSEYRESTMLCAVQEHIGVVPSLSYFDRALAEIRLCVKDDAVTLFDCGKNLTFAAPPASPSQYRNSTRWEVSSVSEAVHNAV